MQKKSVDKLVDECTETIEEVKLAKITLAKNENNYKCSSTDFVYYNWYLIKNNVFCIKFDTQKETRIC